MYDSHPNVFDVSHYVYWIFLLLLLLLLLLFKYKDFFYTILQLFLTRLTFILSALLGQKRIKGIKDDTFFHCTIYLTRLFISIELQKYTTVCNKKDKALIVHLFQKHNLHRIIQMTMTSSKIQMVNIKD